MNIHSQCLIFTALLAGCASSASAADKLPYNQPRSLKAGEKLTLEFDLAQPRATALEVKLADADFGGASLLTEVNQTRLLPYHAFGGDTRYDGVKGKPGMHPPAAKIEANYVLIARWLKAGVNSVTITNAGPGAATIQSVSARAVSGHDLPRYENPIYFDFDVWRQGSLMHKGVDWFLDTMLLGVIPGGGAFVMSYSGGDGLAVKMETEKARIDWGFNRSTFYSIWHLVTVSKDWAEFKDVDGKKDTTEPFHPQFVYPPYPEGSDIALIKPDGYFKALQPGLDGLLAYSTDYIITCEQKGPRGQGFGMWWGDKWSAQGYDVKRWADNYQTEFNKVGRYVHERNPEAPIYAPHWWAPDSRFLLYDTTLKRGFKMSDMTDGMMTHYYSYPFVDYGKDGKLVADDEKGKPPVARPELQYPGGKFDNVPDWEKSKMYSSLWLLIPEIAIDWNRYRLSRTEKDMKLGDPKVNRWNNGQPFDYRAGFDGDERSYNNETCVFDRRYNGPAPYQFLYAMFGYSLLPTAGSEPKQFSVTRSLPLLTDDEVSADLFGEHEQPINMYGQWVSGAAGTHRLKTQDPLYGDMFGYTGFEQATTGDYIDLCGIKERHHRREPHNAWNLVRRACYAFVTAGPVYPAQLNSADTNQLFVKTLLIKQGGRDVIAVYAVNFNDRPRQLDISLPAPWEQPITVQAFDENAADWSDAKERKVTPIDGSMRIRARMPARSPRAIFLYPPVGAAALALSSATTPHGLSPWGESNVAAAPVILKWVAGPGTPPKNTLKYEAQLGKEMLFRPVDIVATSPQQPELTWTLAVPLEADRRYHWRVRAIDADGTSSPWSKAQSFWYQAAKERPVKTVTGDAPPMELTVPRAEPSELLPFTQADNLAHTGMPFSFPQYWEAASEAVDGLAESAWLPDDTDKTGARAPKFPAWWAVRFDTPETVGKVTLLWSDAKLAKDYDVQVWRDKNWQTVKAVKDNASAGNEILFDKPISTPAVRILITAPINATCGLAEVYIR